MKMIKVIGIYLAKSVFQICVWMNDGSIASNRKVSLAKLLDTICPFPAGSMIAMKASWELADKRGISLYSVRATEKYRLKISLNK